MWTFFYQCYDGINDKAYFHGPPTMMHLCAKLFVSTAQQFACCLIANVHYIMYIVRVVICRYCAS